MKVGIGVSLAKDPVRAVREAVRMAKKSVPRPAVSVVFGSVTAFSNPGMSLKDVDGPLP